MFDVTEKDEKLFNYAFKMQFCILSSVDTYIQILAYLHPDMRNDKLNASLNMCCLIYAKPILIHIFKTFLMEINLIRPLYAIS